jgi:60 kDa SS-A/Ro ribonucleoprotein
VPNDIYSTITTRRTGQYDQADTRQIVNSSGAYTFKVAESDQLRRFLILGSTSGSYYASAQKLTKDNAEVVIAAAKADATGLVDLIVELSEAGRAPKQQPFLFSLAVAASLGDEAGRRHAFEVLPRVARTGTMLFEFVGYLEQFRGWGRAARRGVGHWYVGQSVDNLAFQAVKVRSRMVSPDFGTATHGDLLRLSHGHLYDKDTALSDGHRTLFDWVLGRRGDKVELPHIVEMYMMANRPEATVADWRIAATAGLPWEGFPDVALGKAEVWEVMVERGMGMTALIRQLPRLTRLGVTRSHRGQIVNLLTNPSALQKARIHPLNVLVALKTYQSGESARGDSTWIPEAPIVDALDEAFYASFKFVEPSGKRTLIALDVSPSMGQSMIADMPINARQAAIAMAMVTARTEKDHDIVAFTGGAPSNQWWGSRSRPSETSLTELNVSPRQRLDDLVQVTERLPWGHTDISLPMRWALEQGRKYDTIVLFTDNETNSAYHGAVHPHQALVEYRQKMGLDTRLAVVGLVSNPFTVADANDPGSLDVAGFDSAAPSLIADFARGAI